MPSPSSRLTNNVYVGARRGIACQFKEADSIGRRPRGERPTTITCASVPAAQGCASGIGDSVISWSIGFEEAGDLADVNQALAVIS